MPEGSHMIFLGQVTANLNVKVGSCLQTSPYAKLGNPGFATANLTNVYKLTRNTAEEKLSVFKVLKEQGYSSLTVLACGCQL